MRWGEVWEGEERGGFHEQHMPLPRLSGCVNSFEFLPV